MLKPKDIESLEEFIKERNKFPNLKLSIVLVWSRIKKELLELAQQPTNSDLMQLLCAIKELVDVEGGFNSDDTSTYEKLNAVVAQQHT